MKSKGASECALWLQSCRESVRGVLATAFWRTEHSRLGFKVTDLNSQCELNTSTILESQDSPKPTLFVTHVANNNNNTKMT